ncbi:MarR family transcriptional regulator [Heyndrickxia sporothermodurans]|uniref:MarR family winged helix-turn-helix transcriptional regulator n=2 Tax=Heyndrickxia TaxID=2837504 RepID=UPI000D39576D|nr:MarR family transcriptional regulator [Heyndrickxia sporothermodurans]MEB6547780.1 MarR family transcriptional regulator [Heyndrickxia sporothermodurans]MED3656118.1 MarR family transcriptional regulator [Heyndrickxia sporothermodurans]MED3781634.1 MarR family transcriptional regulator [Heyndrickxia sporothermodurans]PTY78767.1 TrmB family transcriptional regulator [Heyndrickxia sporothermodurans]
MDNELYKLELIFRNIYRKMKEQFNSRMNEYVTTNEYMVLKLMYNGKMRVTDLSKTLEVSASHITSITDSLVQKNLIERSRSSKDRRVVDLELTTEGRALIKNLNQITSNYMQEMFGVFTDDEKKELITLLHKLENQLFNETKE